MSLLFIHGVNVRDNQQYRSFLAKREYLTRRYVLEPLSKTSSLTLAQPPYWGKHGANFCWDHASLPSVSLRESLGHSQNAVQDSEIAWSIYDLAEMPVENVAPVETLGFAPSHLVRAAQHDLSRFFEAVFSLFSTPEHILGRIGGGAPDADGHRDALIFIAADRVAHDQAIIDQVALQNDPSDLLDILEQAVTQQLQSLLRNQDQTKPVTEPALGSRKLEVLGASKHADVIEVVEGIFLRLKHLPLRAMSVLALEKWRYPLHDEISRFTGDVFVYLNERGTVKSPGPIVKEVMQSIEDASVPGEPLVVISHSMGCNIMYDILTYYWPDLALDAWITVGGQVGQFEEVKIFKNSDRKLRQPARVRSLKPRVAAWFNIYDPVDIVAFKAEPIFEDVLDIKYKTGLDPILAHSAYFTQPRFYKQIHSLLEIVLH